MKQHYNEIQLHQMLFKELRYTRDLIAVFFSHPMAEITSSLALLPTCGWTPLCNTWLEWNREPGPSGGAPDRWGDEEQSLQGSPSEGRPELPRAAYCLAPVLVWEPEVS